MKELTKTMMAIKIAIIAIILVGTIISCDNGSSSSEDSVYDQIDKVIAEINLYEITGVSQVGYYTTSYNIAVETGKELAVKVNKLIRAGISDEEAKGWLTNLKLCLFDIEEEYEELTDVGKKVARPDLFEQEKKDYVTN